MDAVLNAVLNALTAVSVENWKLFGIGCLGGLTGEVFRYLRIERLYHRRVSKVTAVAVSFFMIILSGFYASAIVAAPTLHAAFFSALSMPAILAVVIGGKPAEKGEDDGGS